MSRNIPKIIGSLLTLKDVSSITGMGRSTIYRMIDAGTFPPQKKYGSAAKWWSTQIDFFLLFQEWNEADWSAWISDADVNAGGES